MALDAVTVAAGITTLRPKFGLRRDECASERVQVASVHRDGRSERAALRGTREELAVFGVAHGASEAARLSAAEWRAVRARLVGSSTNSRASAGGSTGAGSRIARTFLEPVAGGPFGRRLAAETAIQAPTMATICKYTHLM